MLKHKILMALLMMAIVPIPRCAMADSNIAESAVVVVTR